MLVWKNAIPDHEVFHGLHQAALDVPGGGGLDSSVDETLAPSHGMEEQLLCARTAISEERSFLSACKLSIARASAWPLPENWAGLYLAG